MTKINRLTQIPTLDDSDLAVVWQDSSERTRAITIANLRNFIQSTDPNSDAFVKAELIGDDLVLTSHDEAETRIDINLLPEHSVTELKDMPDNLLSGQYLKVNDTGTGFVLTPSSEISAEILIQSNEDPAVDVNVLKFTDGVELSIENKIATIKTGLLLDDQFITKIYTESDLDVLIEDEVATISINNQVSPWPIEEVGIGDSPKVIDKVEHLGIEYQFEASSTFTQSVHLYHVGLPEGAQIKVTVTNVEPNSKPIDVFQLSAGGDLRWPVITPTVFTLRSGLWRVEESSQLLHVANATTFDDDAARKKIVHGVAVDPNGSITMDVNDDGVLVIGGGGVSDEPTFKSVNIDTNGSGHPSFTASIHQDNELHTVIDATRELRVNYKDIGTGTTTGVMGIDNNQAQFLVPIYQFNDQVALAKDIPNTNNFILKHTNAELNKLYVAYQGKYGENRVHYPAEFWQDSNGWTQLSFTGNMIFKAKSNSTGTVGDKILDLRASAVVAHKKLEALKGHKVNGEFSVSDSDENLACYFNHPESVFKVFYPTEITGQLTLSKDSGTVLQINRGAIKFWSSGAIELPNYTAFKDKELIHKEYANTLIAEDKAKGEWIGGVLKDTLNDEGNPTDEITCNNPKHWLEYRKTTFQGDYALTIRQGQDVISSEIVIHLHSSSGMNSTVFQIVTNDGKTATKTIRMGEKWRFFLRKGTWPYYERVDDGTASSDAYDGQGLGVPEGEYLVTGTLNQSSPVGLYYNALNDGSSRGNIELNNDEGYNEFQVIIQGLNKATRSWRVGTGTPGRYSDKTIRTGETWICRVYVDWNASSNTNFFWARIDDGTSSFDAIDTSSFDADAQVEILKKTFENKDLISIPIELPDGTEILVSSVICKIDGKLKKQPFEYQYENGILRVHLNEVCSGIIIAELIK